MGVNSGLGVSADVALEPRLGPRSGKRSLIENGGVRDTPGRPENS